MPTFPALIIDSSFASLQEQVANAFEAQTGLPRIIFMPTVLALFELLGGGCRPVDVVPAVFIQKIHCPILIIHSQTDTMTPVTNAYRLYAAAQETKKDLWLLEDGIHGAAMRDYPEQYAQRVHTFLATHFGD